MCPYLPNKLGKSGVSRVNAYQEMAVDDQKLNSDRPLGEWVLWELPYEIILSCPVFCQFATIANVCGRPVSES